VSVDPYRLRLDFPPLRDGRLVYFDNACMALRPQAGRHCVHSWFNARGVEGTVRVSFYLYNTEEEVATFLGALAKVHEVLA
jgi:selenocysteine lyase/cysteine desulfurase